MDENEILNKTNFLIYIYRRFNFRVCFFITQKKSCWLVYNIASRNREYKDKFTNGGIVEMICKTHVQVNTCHFECKAALIQLGFKIEQVEKMIAEKKRANEMIQRNISLLLRDEN